MPPLPIPDAATVLVKEVERNRDGGKFTQTNFPKAVFMEFFGVMPEGPAVKIELHRVGPRGEVVFEDSAQSVVAKVSGNYRFELNAAKGYIYPTTESGRPVLCVARLTPNVFLYRLLMPGDAEYSEADGLLTDACGPYLAAKRSPTRLFERDAATLRRQWPSCPLWRVSLEALTAGTR